MSLTDEDIAQIRDVVIEALQAVVPPRLDSIETDITGLKDDVRVLKDDVAALKEDARILRTGDARGQG
jgi:hypothetical protein